MSAAAELGAFAHEVTFAALPEPVVAKTKRHILDTFGATLAGARADEPRRTLAVLDRGEAAPVWGTGVRLGARDAALVNGIAAHALELDDSGGCDHSGAVVLPAVMAALALNDRAVSGADLLATVAVGYDVARRVLEACGGYAAHNGAGWHSTATCGVFGAAAAAARILGLDADQTAAALGHAASFAGGLWGFVHESAQTKRLHAGRAAEGGLLAALLAGQGVSGPRSIFADVWGGFLKTFAPTTAEPALLTAGFGEPWKIMRCSIKPYASCRGTHSTVDAVSALLDERGAAGGKVVGVRVRLSQFLMNMCGGRDLASLASAQMSLPYAVAARLVHGAAGIDAYRAERRCDPRIVETFERIELEVDPTQADLDEPVVTLAFADGTQAERHVPVALGAPANPISDADLIAKYRSLAGLVLPADRVEGLADAVLGLDWLADARALLPLLAGTGETGPTLC
ncbi:2-methylcitrate dehydratase [Aliidongia dinghuensis]|uniref:2-methylcitrate dehydratase n=1 Tax=Aliidongia dinghuensis TaxID=1867774 RepID=A0A8J2YWQ4_9PROT|nr:MmgE/PrpD family protein [Aliidongia dinghuensis]GGF28761.1 2-methylcitrate dehydratase [Aliidongia dinghuensis]